MLRVVLALAIAAHGIGHVLFVVPMFSSVNWGQSTHSWLLGDTPEARLIGSLLWGIVIIGFGASVFSLLNQHIWWRDFAVIAALLSTVGLILFWANPVSMPALSALIFNSIILGALVVFHWPSAAAVGA